MQPKFFAGQISNWSGSIAAVPAGWFLCDGNNGTPDLRDRFVVGAASSYAPGASAGALVHDHGVPTDGHLHSLAPGADIGTTPAALHPVLSSATDFAITDAGTNLPTYFALAFIMHGA